MSKPVEVEFLMKDKLTPGMNKAEREALELRNTVRLLEAELERLRLADETAAPNLDQSANIAQIHALEKQLEELRAQLKMLQNESESVQVTPADIPNAQRQFNGLHNSIQQMAREMPSLAMGPQMFFMAISNNLPIFTDELARARKEYDELQKSGKKGTPVWKQVLSSLFSWQTAMTTGIMLLVMYGDEIWDWTKDLFSAKKGVDEFNISLKEMTEIEKDGRAQMVRTRFELKSVINEIKNFTGSKEQEKAKVEELNRKYGESFGYYKTLSEWYDTLIQKSEDYVQVLLHQANVQNLVKKAAEADEEVNKIKAQKPEEAESAMGFFGKWGQYIIQSNMAESGQFYDAQAAIKKHDQEAYDILLKNAENKRDGYLKKAEEEVKKAAEAVGIDGKALTKTIEKFNTYVENGEDKDFHRAKEYLTSTFAEGNIYIVEQKARYATTIGGLDVDGNLQVVDTNGKVIDGLYAAGEIIGGVMGDDSPSGANNGWALTSGKYVADCLSK